MTVCMALLLLIGFLILIVLPITPAWFAFKQFKPSDRLIVIREKTDDVRFFAQRFEQLLQQDLGPNAQSFWQQWSRATTSSVFQNKYLIIGGQQRVNWITEQNTANQNNLITLICTKVTLPSHSTWLKDIYSLNDLITGINSTYRVLCSHQDIVIKEGSHIVRWVDAKQLSIGSHTQLLGRATATHSITLNQGVCFERLAAPVIYVRPCTVSSVLTPYDANDTHRSVFEPDLPNSNMPSDIQSLGYLFKPEDIQEGRYSSHRSIYVPSGTHVLADIICSSNVYIDEGAHIHGSIKTGGDVFCMSNVNIEGSIFSKQHIQLEKNCMVTQLIVADQSVFLGENCTVGTPYASSSLNSDHVFLSAGCTLYGSVFARQKGLTLSLVQATEVTSQTATQSEKTLNEPVLESMA